MANVSEFTFSTGVNSPSVSPSSIKDKLSSSIAHTGSSSVDSPACEDIAVSVPVYELIPYLKAFLSLVTSDCNDLIAANKISK
jgi:hypothetical protein